MATSGSIKITWKFADFSNKTMTIEPIDASDESITSTVKQRILEIKSKLESQSEGFGDGFVSTNGAFCTTIGAAAFTVAETTNIYNSDTYQP